MNIVTKRVKKEATVVTSKMNAFVPGHVTKSIKNRIVHSKKNFSLNMFAECITNRLNHLSRTFFCKKSIRSPSCQTPSATR